LPEAVLKSVRNPADFGSAHNHLYVCKKIQRNLRTNENRLAQVFN